jgi:hypothetical protein
LPIISQYSDTLARTNPLAVQALTQRWLAHSPDYAEV